MEFINWDDEIPNIWEKMFQTTNQIIVPYSPLTHSFDPPKLDPFSIESHGFGIPHCKKPPSGFV